MARIQIKDLPKNMEITKAELESIRGGIGTWPTPERPSIWRLIKSDPYRIDTVPLPE